MIAEPTVKLSSPHNACVLQGSMGVAVPWPIQSSTAMTELRTVGVPDNLRDVISPKLQNENLAELLARSTLLIVDDDRETAEAFKASLDKLKFKEILIATDPTTVTAMVTGRRLVGNPIDLLVLDLYMEKLLGTQLMRELTGLIPAIVIRSGSMMDQYKLDVCMAVERFGANCAHELIAEFRENRRAQGQTQLPIFVTSKSDPFEDFIRAIEAGLILAPLSDGRFEQFLRDFNAALMELAECDIILHQFAEDVKNIVEAAAAALSESPQELASYASAIKHFGAYDSFRKLTKGGPLQTAVRVHEVMNRIEKLKPPQIERQAGMSECLARWQSVYLIKAPRLIQFEKQLEIIKKGGFNPASFVRATAGTLAYFGGEPIDGLCFDQGTTLRNMITNVIELARKHGVGNAPVSVGLTEQRWVGGWAITSAVRDAARRIDSSHFVRISALITRTEPASADCDLLVPGLATLVREKQLLWGVENQGGSDHEIAIYLPYSTPSLLPENIPLATFAESSITFSNEREVQLLRGTFASWEVHAIDADFRNENAVLGDKFSILVINNHIILAGADSHIVCAYKLFDYASQILPDNDVSVERIYGSATRVRRIYGLLYVEKLDSEVVAAFAAFGIAEKNVQKYDFNDRLDWESAQ